MLILKPSDGGIMTPSGIKPTDPRAGLSINHYFLKKPISDIVRMPTETMIWYVEGKRYLIDLDVGDNIYGPHWLIAVIWHWADDNTFQQVTELTLPEGHPAIQFFQTYLEDPL